MSGEGLPNANTTKIGIQHLSDYIDKKKGHFGTKCDTKS